MGIKSGMYIYIIYIGNDDLVGGLCSGDVPFASMIYRRMF